MPKVSIVVLQYNQSDRTLACLESLKKLTYPSYDVIVVDNASDVQHLKAVEYWIETNKARSFQLEAVSSNLGYSGGNNLGIRNALDAGAEYILILNNDTIVEPDFIECLIQTADSGADIVGIHFGHLRWLAAELPLSAKTLNVADISRDHYLSGVALLVKRGIFEKVGFLDERYFLYFEDVEFSLRAQRAGYRLGLVDAKINHATSSSTASLGSPSLLYYHYRNALLFNKTHGPWWVRVLLPVWTIWIVLKQKIKIAIGDHVDESRAILQGARNYRKGKFGQK
ncbi:MAG: hypothetical protein A3A33_00420 [Candidatus Yanofskybacteria bacterium RIFCSPLOWO2_01_FULL_49_25]|uniref:Glycosyltransferase 2-like domain-containing protein n=1 Tax=Candidatus Yanofskybacteria bacterium RIFCSPLOWO2_01_FULL_49_25 TaxID=1802701 RepID=A0A1F8GT13_9BACT|nr:MAG: hypothetical protein A3A33_00420 [Candidatus Yanofskybacteria bacterium RIFCSPLOWO2_01_FULL_49_25]